MADTCCEGVKSNNKGSGLAGQEVMRGRTVQANDLANRLVQAFPKQTLTEQQVIVELLREFLAEGKPVPPKAIAEALNLPLGQVEEILSSWASCGYAYSDEDHRVLAAWGLGLHETAHRFVVNGHTLYAWCAMDTFYLADLLKVAARVESVCPVTEKTISFLVEHEVKDLTPVCAVVSVLVPEDSISTDLRLSFCHFVHFFADAEAGATWIAEQDGSFHLLSVEDAVSVMRSVTRAYFDQVR